MSQFYAEIQGNRGPASRMGSKQSGLWGHIRGWNFGVLVRCAYDPDNDRDVIYVYRTGGSNNAGDRALIATLYPDDQTMFEETLQGQYGVVFAHEANVRKKK